MTDQKALDTLVEIQKKYEEIYSKFGVCGIDAECVQLEPEQFKLFFKSEVGDKSIQATIDENMIIEVSTFYKDVKFFTTF